MRLGLKVSQFGHSPAVNRQFWRNAKGLPLSMRSVAAVPVLPVRWIILFPLTLLQTFSRVSIRQLWLRSKKRNFSRRRSSRTGSKHRGGVFKLLISTPSLPQLELLKGQPLTETEFTTECQKCGASKASTFLVVPESPTRETMALCSGCKEQMMDVARRDLLERLRRQAPHPGEKAIYQPIDELPETADWKIVRPDSKARADVMVKVIQEAGLPGNLGPTAASYVDVGCNTGYFCDRIRRLGFYSEGVDAVKGDIEVARILDSYFRNGHTHFILQDAYDYLEETQDRTFDVTSAFAVFQWVMIQTSVERGITCLERLFAKTKRRCFLEMGYSAEPQYRERLKTNIDREWVRRIMEEKGGFSEIRIFDAKEHGLMFGRDVFVGIKAGVPAAIPSPVKDESEPPRADDVDGQ
jgi:SAM-dependent methyltransferase